MAELATAESLASVRLRAGDASPPLVCLHGFLGSPGSFAAFARASRHPGEIRALWLPGHGLSPWGIELSTSDEALAAMSQALPADGAHLVGYSMGGRVALALAALAPERVRSVVAIGAHAGLEGGELRRARSRLDRERADALGLDGLARFVDAWETLPLFASQASLEPAARAALRSERMAHTERGLATALELLSAGALPAVGAALAERAHPIRLVVGSLDGAYVEHARALSRIHPSVEVFVLRGVGHNVLLEALPDVTVLVDAFVTRVCAASLRSLSAVRPSTAPRNR